MTGPEQDSAKAVSGLGYVCGHLDEIRDTLGDDGNNPATPLQQLLAAAQAGRGQDASGLASLLTAVHNALQVAGDAKGVYGHRRAVDAIGVESAEIVFRCPLGVCNGRDEAEVAEAAPVCAVSGQRLQREALD